MTRGGHRAILAVLVVVILGLTAISIEPSTADRERGPVRGSGSGTGAPSPNGIGPTLAPAANPVGPIGGRLFDVRAGLPVGTSNSVTGLAIDPATGTVYAANSFGASVTAFNEGNGAVLGSATVGDFAGGAYPAGLLLDPLHHRLLVSMSTRNNGPMGGGWMLVLNESTLSIEGNVSFLTAPAAPFEPTFIAYDDATDQAFVENATAGEVAVVDLATTSVTKYLTCPVEYCAEHGYGLVNVPEFHTLVVPTCAAAMWLVNTSNDSTRTLLNGPSNTSLMAWAAFDSVDQTLWIENYSYFGSAGDFLGYNLSTLTLLAQVPGAPPRETGMLYDPGRNVLVATNINGSEEIATFSGTDASLVASSGNASALSHPFFALAVDPTTGVAVGGGPGNGTTIAYALPSLGILRVYDSFPLVQNAVAADPNHAAYLVVSTEPTVLRSEDDLTGATRFEVPLPAGAAPVGVAVDPVTSTAFVADSATGSLLAFNATTGSPLGTYPLGGLTGGLCDVVADPASGTIFVGSTAPAEVIAFDERAGDVAGSFLLTGYSPCRLAISPTTGDLLALSTGLGDTLFDLTPHPAGLLTLTATWTVPPLPLDVGVDGAGTVYVLTDSGTELVSLDGSNGSLLQTLNLTGSPGTALAVDPTDGLLFVAAERANSLEVIASGTLSVAGSFPAPARLGAVEYDDTSGAFTATTASTGQVLEATLVAVPSSPTALALTPGNHTLSASWGPPVSTGADPVLGYRTALSPSGYRGTSSPSTGASLSASFGNLTNGLAYNFSVAVYSAAGNSTQLARASATPAGVPYPPTNVSVTVIGTTAMAVNWSAPVTNDGAPIQDYLLRYAPTAGGLTYTIDASTRLSENLSGLAEGTEYTINVTAESAAGLSHPSTTLRVTTGSPSSTTTTAELLGLVALVALAGAVTVEFLRRRRSRVRPPSLESRP